jgi:transporter family-2 protein
MAQMKFFLIPFIVLAGILQAFGATMNAQLKTSLQNPWLASAVSFGLIVPIFIGAFAIIDHYGWMNMPPHPLNFWRGIGGGLMVAGIFLVSRT